jgi:hypothetical protein
MYRNCIFCSGDLGRNQSLESFPVGNRLAFDAWKGRLWAVCGRCRRWNLAPLEERWEAVEAAERMFRDSRLRVHSENIGLARLPDGSRMIRVGRALPREMAAWRYGDELVRRRRRALFWGGAGVVGAAAVGVGAVAAVGAAVVPTTGLALIHLSQLGLAIGSARGRIRVVHRIPAERSVTGEPLVLRAADIRLARVVAPEEGTLPAMLIPGVGSWTRVEEAGRVRWLPPEPVRVEGEDAQRLLGRALVSSNRAGAAGRQVDEALRSLESAGSRDELFARVAARRGGLFTGMIQPSGGVMPDVRGGFRRFVGTFRGERIAGGGMPLPPPPLPAHLRLALEMALHEEGERRALEGELAELELAWREAEEIAAIADALPDDPPGVAAVRRLPSTPAASQHRMGRPRDAGPWLAGHQQSPGRCRRRRHENAHRPEPP